VPMVHGLFPHAERDVMVGFGACEELTGSARQK
jgi:hypothetical protein